MKVKGCCPLDCQDSCAWVVHVEEGKVIGVEGAKDHPVTRGVLCAKVKDYETRLTAPGRLLQPLRRAGAKGSGRFEPVSWDAALGEIAGRFRSIIAEHGAEALMPFYYLGSQGAVQRQALNRVFHALGASRATGGVCAVSAVALLAEGHPIGVDPEETPDARLILLWGQNTLTTCHHQWHFIDAARRNGARLVAIDPVRSRTARQCDAHLAIRPGTDPILAAAIGRHLLETGKADLALASLWVGDLDDYRRAVAPWTFASAARATGLAAADIESLAQAFAEAQPALIRAGIAPQQSRNGEDFVRSLSALAILGGHWRRRGGGLSILSMPAYDETPAGRPDLLTGAPRALDLGKLGEVLDEAQPPVRGLMVWCANPAATQIDAPRVKRGLMRDDLFTVVADHFLTDTARYADIVLPATTQFEHVDVQGAWGHHYVLANEAAIAPMGEARSGGAIMRGLAAKLGLDHPALGESDAEIAAATLPAGWSFAGLMSDGWRKSPSPRPEIAMRSTKLRIAVDLSATTAPGGDALRLITPKSHYFLNSTFANMPRHRAAQGAPVAVLHPAEAGRRGLAEGTAITVRRNGHAVCVRLVLSDTVCEGIITLEGKWWEEGDAAATPLNRLTPSAWSPAGQPAYNDTWVSIAQAP
jgi:anaerobic selenocysteine-containing dehydrogenase